MQLWSAALVIVISHGALIVAWTGFAKDENEELVEFPPTILQTFDSSVPVGHLRPLGQFVAVQLLLCFSIVISVLYPFTKDSHHHYMVTCIRPKSMTYETSTPPSRLGRSVTSRPWRSLPRAYGSLLAHAALDPLRLLAVRNGLRSSPPIWYCNLWIWK